MKIPSESSHSYSNRQRTLLLVSVRDLVEAQLAVEGGVDILDLKEPRHGSLGPVAIPLAAEIGRRWRGRLPLSLALGELAHTDTVAAPEDWISNFDFLKIGLAGLPNRGWQRRWSAWRKKLPHPERAVLVAYVDHQAAQSPEVEHIVSLAIAEEVRFVLFDTYRKDHRRLTDHLSLSRIAETIDRLGSHSVRLALAGRLDRELILSLIGLRPSIIAVRSAVCGGDRAASLSTEHLQAVRECLIRAAASVSIEPDPKPAPALGGC
jgi:uncharacterized protein (UPF0264 family)